MKRVPLKLSPVTKSAIWGGTVLRRDWGKPDGGSGVAESWELTVRRDENSVIVGGEADGMTLAAWIEQEGADTVSPDYRVGDRFPLLIKLIDAGERLSVQVHPDDSYALEKEAARGDTGKTEMWYIVDAEEGASIVYGLSGGASPEKFLDAAVSGNTEALLRRVPVSPGECYFIPSGQVHAIGGGILIAEIQQNSDLTYRIYDYDRRSADGKPRELHLEKAREVIRNITDEEIEEIRYARGGKDDPRLLANCPYFKVSRLVIDGARIQEQGRESFASLLCVSGSGTLSFEGEDYPIQRGDSYFIPAGMGTYTCKGEMTLICSEL